MVWIYYSMFGYRPSTSTRHMSTLALWKSGWWNSSIIQILPRIWKHTIYVTVLTYVSESSIEIIGGLRTWSQHCMLAYKWFKWDDCLQHKLAFEIQDKQPRTCPTIVLLASMQLSAQMVKNKVLLPETRLFWASQPDHVCACDRQTFAIIFLVTRRCITFRIQCTLQWIIFASKVSLISHPNSSKKLQKHQPAQ